MPGAAMAHNFGLAGSADSVSEAGEYIVGGIKTNGQVAVGIALDVLVDDPCAVENVTRFAGSCGYKVAVTEEGPDFKLLLKK